MCGVWEGFFYCHNRSKMNQYKYRNAGVELVNSLIVLLIKSLKFLFTRIIAAVKHR